MENVQIILILDHETFVFYKEMAAKVDIPLEDFISEILLNHFEICSFLSGNCPEIELFRN